LELDFCFWPLSLCAGNAKLIHGTRSAINWHITVLASLVRVATSFDHRPNGMSATSVAPKFERKWSEGITTGLGPGWTYRRIGASQEQD
jgi:hypothetical protein